ncbi:Phage integrase family protein [Pustulibacterium marinum]|uniref:Phage integrase family protein n=1 Tax=Pustulibacterium marinum TaxID=1224947 RepID=A0A1I7I9J3_9FLAO|nr:aldo/keto reductase [Pustulibacterium marinum]SFU69510.1 Phage integrase family protein [Pustulibacterium marinum]
MQYRKLRDVKVSAVGYGCMGLSHAYGPLPEANDSLALIRYAFDQGCNFFDTAEGYGNGHNEMLLGKAVKDIRKDVVIATKLYIQKDETLISREALLQQAAETLQIKKRLTMHIARHSFGNLSGDKIPIQMLQKLYRHSSILTTIGYQAHFMQQEADDALDSVVNF